MPRVSADENAETESLVPFNQSRKSFLIRFVIFWFFNWCEMMRRILIKNNDKKLCWCWYWYWCYMFPISCLKVSFSIFFFLFFFFLSYDYFKEDNIFVYVNTRWFLKVIFANISQTLVFPQKYPKLFLITRFLLLTFPVFYFFCLHFLPCFQPLST